MIGEIERALKEAYRYIDAVPSELDKEPFLLLITKALMALRQIPTGAHLALVSGEVSEEMVERVARALFEKGPSQTKPAHTWGGLTTEWREAFRATARVAIEAMREPRRPHPMRATDD